MIITETTATPPKLATSSIIDPSCGWFWTPVSKATFQYKFYL